jgi:hypothetical protein
VLIEIQVFSDVMVRQRIKSSSLYTTILCGFWPDQQFSSIHSHLTTILNTHFSQNHSDIILHLNDCLPILLTATVLRYVTPFNVLSSSILTTLPIYLILCAFVYTATSACYYYYYCHYYYRYYYYYYYITALGEHQPSSKVPSTVISPSTYVSSSSRPHSFISSSPDSSHLK